MKRAFRARARPRSKSRKHKSPGLLRRLRVLWLVLAGATLLQYIQQGEVTWPLELQDKARVVLRDFATRANASWKKAATGLEHIGAAREGRAAKDYDIRGRVVRIADGDTVSVLEKSGRQHTIRLYGIDAPERDQNYGNSSTSALASMVDGKPVGVVVVDTDDYGRIVGTLYQAGDNINLAMINGGHAWWYRRYAAYERHLAAAEETARREKEGLWANPEATPPWEWRRSNR